MHISKQNASALLHKMGFGEIDLASGVILSKPNLSTEDLVLIRNLVRGFGIDSIEAFILRGNWLTAYLQRNPDRKMDKTYNVRIFFEVLRDFAPHLLRLNSSLFRRKGYSFFFNSAADPPFNFAIEIIKKQSNIGRINFDLSYLHGKPGVVIGSFQGGNKEDVDQFKRQMKIPPMLFLLKQFKRGFPQASQRLALHPQFHPYRKMDPAIIASRLTLENIITEKQRQQFVDNIVFETAPTTDDERSVAKKIEDEIVRMRTATTGMHYAALNSAGFKRRMKSRYLRTKAFMVERQQKAARKLRRMPR